jgi:hypothetical protein
MCLRIRKGSKRGRELVWRRRTISTVCLWKDGQQSPCNNMTVLGLQSKRVYSAARLSLS